jgi:hypothetical protein
LWDGDGLDGFRQPLWRTARHRGSSEINLNPLAVRAPHFPAKAKRVIHIFANGGASHVDTFDPKPALDEWHGKEIPVKLRTERKTTTAFKSPFKFEKRGQSGIEVSELFAKTAESIDEMCVIPLDARGGSESRAIAAADELRGSAPAASRIRLMAHLWPWIGESESAGLYHDVPRRLPHPGIAELAERVSTGCVPGYLHRYEAHGH